MNNKMVHTVAFILLIAGGLNWLLVAFGTNIVETIFGGYSNIVYILVGLSAIYSLITHKGTCTKCNGA